MLDELHALLPIVGFLGLGGGLTIASLAFGIWQPRFLFPAVLVAVVAAGGTYIYARGAHDDYVLQQAKTIEALQKQLTSESKARKDAEAYVQKHPAPQVPHRHGPVPVANCPTGLRDDRNRDCTVKAVPKPSNVPPVEGDHVQPFWRHFFDDNTNPHP